MVKNGTSEVEADADASKSKKEDGDKSLLEKIAAGVEKILESVLGGGSKEEQPAANGSTDTLEEAAETTTVADVPVEATEDETTEAQAEEASEE